MAGHEFTFLLYFESFTSMFMRSIDVMHTILLGECKHLFATLWKFKYFHKASYALMQSRMDELKLASESGGVPQKIQSLMSHVKADQVRRGS